MVDMQTYRDWPNPLRIAVVSRESPAAEALYRADYTVTRGCQPPEDGWAQLSHQVQESYRDLVARNLAAIASQRAVRASQPVWTVADAMARTVAIRTAADVADFLVERAVRR